MDPLSVIASSLTLLEAVSTTGKLVLSFRSSPSDLQQLELQLNTLQLVADKLNAHVQGWNSTDSALVSQPANRLKNARTMFDKRFKRKADTVAGKSNFKHSLRYNDIKRLEKELLYIRQEFSTAMGFLSISTCGSVTNSYRLELSSSFAPEHCATPGPMMETLLVYSTTELRRTDTTRVHRYFLLFAQNRRRWRRIIATITTTTDYDFVYQGICHQGARDYALGPLHVSFRKALTGLQDQLFDSVTKLSMEMNLGHGGEPRIIAGTVTCSENPNEIPSTKAVGSLADIRSRGLAVFTESDVVVVENLSQSWHLVRIGSQQYLERVVPFVGKQSALEEDLTYDYWQRLQPFLALQGSHSIANFGGFIMDDTRTQIRGHVIKLPERGILSHLMLAADQADVLVPWQCKEKWIRQLIRAVAEAHQRGVVIGNRAQPQLWLDINDNLVIVDLKRRSEDLQQRAGNTPPEFRGDPTQNKADAAAGHMLTFTSDIFGLGLAIWLICEQRQSALADVFCRRYPCSNTYRYRCTAPHSNPVELPLITPNLKVPAYIDSIIQLCRQREPTKRPSATTLLQILDADGLPLAALNGQAVPVSFKAIDETRYRIYCDECAKNCTFELYSCRICDQGDFDLCPDCHKQGVKCWDATHHLHRRRRKDGQWVFDDAV